MKIDIATGELQAVRGVVNDAIYRLEHAPHPEVGSRSAILRKLNRKLNRALKAAFGHDCCGDRYYT